MAYGIEKEIDWGIHSNIACALVRFQYERPELYLRMMLDEISFGWVPHGGGVQKYTLSGQSCGTVLSGEFASDFADMNTLAEKVNQELEEMGFRVRRNTIN